MSNAYPKNGYEINPQDYPNCVRAQNSAIWHYADMVDEAYWNRIRERMREMGVKQADLARQLNLPSQSAVSNLFVGKRNLLASEKIEMERYLQIKGDSNVQMVPIIGITQAGQWREAINMPLGHMPLLSGIAGRKAFAVEVKGDSMDMMVREGGFAVIDPDDRQLYNGSIYLLENGEYETTIKAYRTNPARFCPMSSNPEHQEFSVGDLPFKVIGKVVWTGSRAP